MGESGEHPDTTVSQVRAAVLAALGDRGRNIDPLVQVCRACVELLPVDGASISVISGTRHRETLYASDDIISRLESLQFTLGEGPCFEAFETSRPVLVPDLTQASTVAWPVFASEITDQPVGALFAFPIQSGAISIGAMDMYRRRAGWLSSEELATALRVMDVAAMALLGPMAVGLAEGGEEWAASLARNREEVHQATGMLMAQFGIPAEQALARLRGYAFATSRLIEDVSRDIVDRRLPLRDTEI